MQGYKVLGIRLGFVGQNGLAKPVTVHLRSYLTIENFNLLLFNCACFV